jgi:hypothetical protein
MGGAGVAYQTPENLLDAANYIVSAWEMSTIDAIKSFVNSAYIDEFKQLIEQ